MGCESGRSKFAEVLRFAAILVINNPAAVVEAVVVAGRGDKNYLGGIFSVVFKNIGLPLKRFYVCLGIGEIVLLVGRSIKRDFVTALFELEVHGHAAAQKICMLVISDDVGSAHPFVGGGTGFVGYVVAFFVFEAEKAADVV